MSHLAGYADEGEEDDDKDQPMREAERCERKCMTKADGTCGSYGGYIDDSDPFAGTAERSSRRPLCHRRGRRADGRRHAVSAGMHSAMLRGKFVAIRTEFLSSVSCGTLWTVICNIPTATIAMMVASWKLAWARPHPRIWQGGDDLPPASAVPQALFEPTVIVTCVRWYLRYSLSLREVRALIAERGLSVCHTSIWRWTQTYGPEIKEQLAIVVAVPVNAFR